MKRILPEQPQLALRWTVAFTLVSPSYMVGVGLFYPTDGIGSTVYNATLYKANLKDVPWEKV